MPAGDRGVAGRISSGLARRRARAISPTDTSACCCATPAARTISGRWSTPEGPLRLDLSGPFDTDDGAVLVDWALAGHGVVNLARFLLAEHLASGALVEVLPDTPPTAAELAIVYPHKRLMDPKLRVFIDYMAAQCRTRVEALHALANGGAAHQKPR